MPEIQKLGRLLRTDSQGYLVNESNFENIQPPWTEAVAFVRKTLLQRLPDQIHSLYLRGSIPRGLALPNVSDVDILAVLHSEPKATDLSWVEASRQEFKKKFPFVLYLDLEFVSLPNLLKKNGELTKRFIIKVAATNLHGPNLAEQIPPFKPTVRVAFFMNGNIQEVLSSTQSKLSKLEDPGRIQVGCAWVSKRLLRTGFGLVMEREQTFTRDLYFCYEVFSKYYPEQESSMRQALEWAVNPIVDKEKILEFLNGFGSWMVQEARRVFLGK